MQKRSFKIGDFSRGGKNRVLTKAADHDFKPKTVVTPYGILMPEFDELFLYFTESKITSDFIVDILEDFWISQKHRFTNIKTLLINQDNGPENHSYRTQFMKRIVELAKKHELNIRLVYYPPYHSKYNPIERTWAVLEKHWNGSILDEVETAIKFAESMKWNGNKPTVKLVTETYQTGVKLTKKVMNQLEKEFERMVNITEEKLYNLGRWFVDICFNNT
jgi:Rhodopirellula transposase DDE domain